MTASSPTALYLLSSAAIVFGLCICFFGYRIFRLALAIGAFVIGASFIAGAAFKLTEGTDIWVILIAGLVGGFIAAIILLFLYSTGVFLLGALFGIALFSGVTALTGINAEPILYVIPALVGGIIALFLQKFMIVIMTSLTGAWISVIGALYLINNNIDPLNPEYINNMSEIEIYRIVLSLLALAGLGFVAQYLIFPRKTEILDKSEIQIEDKSQKDENHS